MCPRPVDEGGGVIDRRTFLQALIGGSTSVVLAGCGSSARPVPDCRPPPSAPLLPPDALAPRPRPVLRIAGGDVGVMTPFGYRSPPAYFLMVYVYDTLVWTDSTGAVVPWLATSHASSEDGLTHIFELRDGVRWHDGRPLTVDDVVFTFEYFATDAGKNPLILGAPQHVAAVRARGPRTVEFRLDKPAVTFLQFVAGRVPIIPRHVWSAVKNPFAQDTALVVGTGPYRLESYSPFEGTYRFKANDEFFLGRPFVEAVELRPVSDDLNAVLAGQLDVGGQGSTGLTPRALAPFQCNPQFGVAQGPPDFLFALYWNLAAGGALSDVRFRRACARAIDREGMVRRLAGGNGEPGNPGFLPRGHGYRVEVEQYRLDRAAANRLLDDAGYRRGPKGVRVGPDGKPLRFKLTTLGVDPGVDELVVSGLDEVGVQVEIAPTTNVATVLNEEKFDMAILIYGGHSGDPDIMRQVYSSREKKGFSFRAARGYVNAEFDDLADRQLVTHDEEERKRLVARMQEIVADDLPLLHLFYPTPFVVYRKSVLDQVSWQRGGIGPLNKQALVTGVATGGTEIRATA